MCAPPLLIVVNEAPWGGDACPWELSPQHTGVPSPRKAQTCRMPLLIAVQLVPWGGDAWPWLFDPQHNGEPSLSRAQVKEPPALREMSTRPAANCTPRAPADSGRSPTAR